jgi:hypothetical protein
MILCYKHQAVNTVRNIITVYSEILTTLNSAHKFESHLLADCLENLGSSTSHNPMHLHGFLL